MKELDNRDVFFEICTLLFGSLMVFYQLMPSILVAGVSAFFFLFGYVRLERKYGTIESIVVLSVIAIPTSTISIIGTDYSKLPLTWYNLLILISVVFIGMNGKISKKYFTSVFLFIIIEILVNLNVPSLFNAFKQYLIMVLFLFAFFIGQYLKKYGKKEIYFVLVKYYLIGTFCIAFQVLLQRIFILKTGRIIGHYAVMGQSRIAYGGIMGDWSFATLYLATGCLFILLDYLNNGNVTFVKFLGCELILSAAMLMVSARTGIISLTATIILYFAFNIRRFSKRYIFMLVICASVIPYLIVKLMSSRGGQALFETSGRAEVYIRALKFWENKIFFGYGLGLDNLYTATGLSVPHNFFVQYLVQIGIVGLVLFLLPFVPFIKDNIRGNGYTKWLFFLVIIGSMFIPDIVSSRYFYGIVLLCMTNMNGNKSLNWRKNKNET